MAEQRPLPVRPRPLPDETLLSWAVRLARSNALEFQQLLSLALHGKRHSLMECDIDLYARPELVQGLAKLSNRSEADIEAQTLRELLTNTTVRDFGGSIPRQWVTFQVAKNRRPTKNWTTLCVLCLRADPIPYFRRAWRLAFTTTCPIHRVRLIDCCPHCTEPFNYQCFDLGEPHFDHIVPVCVCGSCGRDARETYGEAAECSPRVAKYERALYRTLCRGKCRERVHGWIYAGALFEVLNQLIGRCRNSRRIRCLRDEGLDRGAIFPLEREDVPKGSFHTWTLDARYRAMCGVAELLAGWPGHFVDCARHYGVTSYDLRGDEELPYWFDSVVLEHFYRKWWSPSLEEALTVRALVKASGETETYYNVRRWLGLFYQKSEYVMKWVEQGRSEQLRLPMRRIDCFGLWRDC